MMQRARNEGGFTLLQVLVATALLVVMLGVITQIMVTGASVADQSQAAMVVDWSAQEVLDFILADLRQTSIDPASGSGWTFSTSGAPAAVPATAKGYVRFHRASGYDMTTGKATFGGPIEYWFDYNGSTSFSLLQTGGLGLDLNGSGKIDLGKVVRREAGVTTTIATNVLEGGFIVATGIVPPSTIASVSIICAKQLADKSVYVRQVVSRVATRN
ncbi:MAG: PulJ/GspJ family protein [Polyangiaceae bacterium]